MSEQVSLILIGGGIGIVGTIIGSLVGISFSWIKEYFQKKAEVEERRLENLYGPIAYQLLILKVIDVNKKKLIAEISEGPISENIDDNLKRWAEVNPINEQWRMHLYKLRDLFEKNAGYIKKEHIKLVEDLLDGFIKRDITKGGESIYTTQERIEKIFNAVDKLKRELLDK